ncbi:MAG: SIMPL domain-containing protein [Planctomycetota bacterium]
MVCCVACTSLAVGGTLTVEGRGVAVTEPDIIEVTLAVTERRSEPGEAFATLDEVVAEVIEELEDLDLDGARIFTDSFSVDAIYKRDEHGNWTPTVLAYEGTASVVARTTELTRVRAIIKAGMTEKSVRLQSIQYSSSRQDELKLEAIRRASTHAKVQAETLADAMGVTLGGVEELSLNESRHRGGGGGSIFDKDNLGEFHTPRLVSVTATVNAQYTTRSNVRLSETGASRNPD